MLLGGSGLLGKALFRRKPPDVFIINVSREGSLVGPDALNYHCDLFEETPEQLVEGVSNLTDHVDVFINAAYYKKFSSIRDLNRARFLQEIELDVFVPLKVGHLFAMHFWPGSQRTESIAQARKIINVSSAAAFAKTSRPELATYSGAKAALTIMTEYLHETLYVSSGVSAHIVAPGSLEESVMLQKTVDFIWDLQRRDLSDYSLTRFK